jgi:hypothetical protein
MVLDISHGKTHYNYLTYAATWALATQNGSNVSTALQHRPKASAIVYENTIAHGS